MIVTSEESSVPQPSKREEILETAGRLFIESGFQAVSMDQIAVAVPVSKPTLYAHFKDKRELFAAVVAARCEAFLSAIKPAMIDAEHPEPGLRAFAHQFLELLLTRPALQLHRTMVAESESFPDMARMFYETGPKRMHRLLADYLAVVDREAALNIPDPDLSADIFIGMIKGRMHLRCLIGLESDPDKGARDKLVDAAVSIFIAGHQ